LGLFVQRDKFSRVILESDLKDRSFLQSASSSVRHFYWSLNLYIHTLLSEFRTVLQRTEFRLKKRLDQNGVDLGAHYRMRPNGHLEPNTRTQNRIRDTRYLLSKHPWATLVDLQIFLEGWDKGAESRSEE
jgi:hypothetical protein